MVIPQDIALCLSDATASTLTRFLEISASEPASPRDAEERILASLALTLSRRRTRQ